MASKTGAKTSWKHVFKITEQLETLYFSPNRTQKKGSLGTREMLISDSPYRAIIQIDEEAKKVFILRILHTSRNI